MKIITIAAFLLLGCNRPQRSQIPAMAKVWAEQMLGKDAVVNCSLHGPDWSECTVGLNGRLYVIKCVNPGGCYLISNERSN